MALVVFLRGINVGGHRSFRPTKLAEALKHLGAVNIGAAGTLVLRRPMTQAQARAEVARRLPFVAEIVVCQGRRHCESNFEKSFYGTVGATGCCPLCQRAIPAPSLDAVDAHAFPVQRSMADEDPHQTKPIRHRNVQAQHEGHRIPRCTGPALRCLSDHSQMEYHRGDCQGAP